MKLTAGFVNDHPFSVTGAASVCRDLSDFQELFSQLSACSIQFHVGSEFFDSVWSFQPMNKRSQIRIVFPWRGRDACALQGQLWSSKSNSLSYDRLPTDMFYRNRHIQLASMCSLCCRQASETVDFTFFLPILSLHSEAYPLLVRFQLAFSYRSWFLFSVWRRRRFQVEEWRCCWVACFGIAI